MSIESWAAVKEENGHWAFTWTGAGTFYVWLNGVLLGEAEDGVYDFAQDGYYAAPPPLEITDDPDTAQSQLYPPFATLQWREIDGATAYYVEEYVDSIWVGRRTLMAALDARGNPGTPVAFTFALVCNPAPPEVVDAFAAGDLVIGAA